MTRWFARLHDVKRVLEAERIMRNLSEGDHRHVRPNPKISSTALEAGFDDDGRLYFVRHNNTLRFVRIGDKHTQDRDIAWVKRNFP